MTLIKIPTYWKKKCEKFAEEAIESSKNLYYYRGTKNLDKIKEDIYVGKMGEVGVYLHLKGYGCSKPDFAIYKGRRKSFDADLFVNQIPTHVKSQTKESANRYGNSYLFQKSDPVVINPNEDLFYGTLVEGNTVTIIKECKINELTFEPCKVSWFNKTKVAIYV